MRSTWPIVVGLLLLASCRAQPYSAERQPQPSNKETSGRMEELRGKLFVTGNEPATAITLVPSQGAAVVLLGNLRPELARLSGADMAVEGVRKPSGDPGLEVYRYRVLKIDGEVPTVGTLTMSKGVLSLAAQDTIPLDRPPGELLGKIGAKVWIVGSPVGDKLGVQSYGVIKEP